MGDDAVRRQMSSFDAEQRLVPFWKHGRSISNFAHTKNVPALRAVTTTTDHTQWFESFQ